MKGILHYLEGLREALWDLRFVIYLWLLSLGLVIFAYFPVHKFFSSRLSHFSDWTYIMDHPAYIALVYKNSGVLFAGIFALLLLFYIFTLMVEGGIWAGILRREPFSYWKKYFGRFLLLEILTPIIYLPHFLVAGLLFLLIKPIPIYKEKIFSLAAVAYALVLLFILTLASISKDYAKLAVVRDNRSVLRAIVFSWKLTLMRWLSSGLMGMAALLLWAIPFFLISPLLHNLPTFIYFLAYQPLVLLKVYSKIALFIGEKYMAREFS